MGLTIIESPNLVTLVVGERKYPLSRHRSARIEKKLRQRYGGTHHMIEKPMAYQSGRWLYMHPTLAKELRERMAKEGVQS